MEAEESIVVPPFRITPVVLHVLLSMADGEVHGYRIMREVEERSRGGVKIGPGSLYFTLNRLLENRMIEESEQRPDPELDDARRRYYCLTDFGRAVLRGEVGKLADIVALARDRGLLSGPSTA